MDFLQRFFIYAALAATMGLIVGLFKPWMMLWWEDTQNRKKVIKIYGGIALVSYVLYWASLLILTAC